MTSTVSPVATLATLDAEIRQLGAERTRLVTERDTLRQRAHEIRVRVALGNAEPIQDETHAILQFDDDVAALDEHLTVLTEARRRQVVLVEAARCDAAAAAANDARQRQQQLIAAQIPHVEALLKIQQLLTESHKRSPVPREVLQFLVHARLPEWLKAIVVRR